MCNVRSTNGWVESMQEIEDACDAWADRVNAMDELDERYDDATAELKTKTKEIIIGLCRRSEIEETFEPLILDDLVERIYKHDGIDVLAYYELISSLADYDLEGEKYENG